MLCLDAQYIGPQGIILRACLEKKPAQHTSSEHGDNEESDEIFDSSHDSRFAAPDRGAR
ncbi:MAG: hypothetical protein IPK32_23350 [Verrucomicrobiaceae bacterium]|nr:hypothetical protein [Verrucomicrobiaceae bacterium]